MTKFAAFVNVDSGLLNLLTDNATIVGDETDHHHVGLVLASASKWLEKRDEEVRLKAHRAGGAS